MLHRQGAWLPVGVLLAAAMPALGIDLSKIPRTIAKEPQYESGNPEYCLVVFGPEAEQRFWLARDGDRYYCDCNGNGDLTDPGESWTKPKPKKKGFFATLFGGADDLPRAPEFTLKVGPKEVDATLTISTFDGSDYVTLEYEPVGALNAHGDGDGKLKFATSASSAPIVHFGGPLTLGFDKPYRLSRHDKTELYLRLGTSGLGPGTFAARSTQGVPADVHPLLEIEYPPKSPGEAPLREKFTLDKRCCGGLFQCPVQVGEKVGNGKARVTVSFPAWKQGEVKSSTFELPIVTAGSRAAN